MLSEQLASLLQPIQHMLSAAGVALTPVRGDEQPAAPVIHSAEASILPKSTQIILGGGGFLDELIWKEKSDDPDTNKLSMHGKTVAYITFGLKDSEREASAERRKKICERYGAEEFLHIGDPKQLNDEALVKEIKQKVKVFIFSGGDQDLLNDAWANTKAAEAHKEKSKNESDAINVLISASAQMASDIGFAENFDEESRPGKRDAARPPRLIKGMGLFHPLINAHINDLLGDKNDNPLDPEHRLCQMERAGEKTKRVIIGVDKKTAAIVDPNKKHIRIVSSYVGSKDQAQARVLWLQDNKLTIYRAGDGPGIPMEHWTKLHAAPSIAPIKEIGGATR